MAEINAIFVFRGNICVFKKNNINSLISVMFDDSVIYNKIALSIVKYRRAGYHYSILNNDILSFVCSCKSGYTTIIFTDKDYSLDKGHKICRYLCNCCKKERFNKDYISNIIKEDISMISEILDDIKFGGHVQSRK